VAAVISYEFVLPEQATKHSALKFRAAYGSTFIEENQLFAAS
jgi:hypothetical protein